MLKKFALQLAVIYSLLLALVSLIDLGNVPDIKIDSGDKIFHLLAYFLMLILWFNVFYPYKNLMRSKALLFAAILSFSFGIIIELLQGGLTISRALDVYDILANTLGIVLAVLVVKIYYIKHVKKL